MERKLQLAVFLMTLMLLLVFTNLHFFGCAASKPKEKTPEQLKAEQDSLFQLHKNYLARMFSFGFEPYKHGDYAKAKRYFKRVAEKDTSGIYGKVLYQRLGDCYLRLNMPDSAEWAYMTGVGRLPNNPYFYAALGYIFRAGGRTDEAIGMYEKLTELESDSSSYHAILGELYIKADEPDKAIASYETAVRLNPSDQKANEILGNLQAQYGSIDDVIATQKTLVENDPENMKYRLDLAQTYHKASEFENAIEQLLLVIEKEPQNLRALEFLGDSYKNLDRFNDAVAIYNRILESNPDDKKNLCNLAMCYTSLGRFTTAMREVGKALSIDGNYGLAYITRGMVYEASAERCVSQKGGKIAFDDKLVYQKAYDNYNRAKQDIEWKTDADRRLSYLSTLIPTREDRFMHQNQTTPRGECYQWIQ